MPFNQSRIIASNAFNLSAVTIVAILFVLITIPQARFVDKLIERDNARIRAEADRSMAFLEMRDVHKRYGDHPVLRGLNLSVNEHQVVCLIGPSGCGKSTLLRCINGLDPIQGGEIRLENDRVSGLGVDVNRLRQQVGIVFQAFNLFPHMSVPENVTLAPIKVLKVDKAEAESKAMALLKRIGLEAKATAYPDRLSGGQQQRVAITRALAMEPELLLLDEITFCAGSGAGLRSAEHCARSRRPGHDHAARDPRDGLRAGSRLRSASCMKASSMRKDRPSGSSAIRMTSGPAPS